MVSKGGMMCKYTRIILCLLFASMSSSLLSSCLWTSVSTHTLTDAVGKEDYKELTGKQRKKAEIYRRNGVYYLRHTFYKAPARGKIYTCSILSKHGCVNPVYLSDKVEYREGMQQVYLYSALDKETLKELFPRAHFKDCANNESVLPQSAFEGATPVAVITDNAKLAHLYRLGSHGLPSERKTINYVLMPVTGALYVADIPLTIATTAAGWVGVNVPMCIFALFFCAIDSIK